jgi:phosphohistidine phosphatase
MVVLLILRHAKSDWNAAYSRDHDRPLNNRGIKAAEKIGRMLTQVERTPDLVVASSATRTLQTARLAAKAGAWNAPIRSDPQLYGGSVGDMLSVIESVEDVETLMIVGHQPTCASAISRLTGANVTVKTATVAAIEFPTRTWSNVLAMTGTLRFLVHPRML